MAYGHKAHCAHPAYHCTCKKSLRPFGDLTQDLEDLLGEAAEEHDLQMGEVLAWVHNYLTVHYPDCIEVYEDGESPEYYYGPRRD